MHRDRKISGYLGLKSWAYGKWGGRNSDGYMQWLSLREGDENILELAFIVRLSKSSLYLNSKNK